VVHFGRLPKRRAGCGLVRVLPVVTGVTRLFSFVSRVLGRRRPSVPPAAKKLVVCVGCVPDGTVLDRLLEPGEYEAVFLASSEGAYSRIAGIMPSRVILCMQMDDELSLQLLSMLTIDPRTQRIPVITCVPSLATADAASSLSGGAELHLPALTS